MATPAEGGTTPPVPPGVPGQVAQQQAAQDRQAAEVAANEELRALITELVKQTTLPFDPVTVRKGIVTVSSAGSPPTASIQLSGDTTTTISGVRHVDGYTPTVGETVLVMKQGADILIMGKVADATNTWTQATLAAGFSHNGDSQGNLEYRRRFVGGEWIVEFRGAVARSSGTTVISALPAEYRPATKRKLLAARGFGGGSVAVQIIINTTGLVELDGENHSWPTDSEPQTTTSNSSDGTTQTSDPAPDGGAVNPSLQSGVSSSHSHSIGHKHYFGHTHEVNAHSHSLVVTPPDWVSFNGVYYYL